MPEITFDLGPITLIAITLAVIACAVLLWPERNRPQPIDEDVVLPPHTRPDPGGGQPGGNEGGGSARQPPEGTADGLEDAADCPAPSEHRGTFAPKQQPDPPTTEELVGPYLVLRVTNPTQVRSSTLYPMLGGDLEPTLWDGETTVRRSETIEDLGRGLDDERKRTGAKAQVLCTNRRLIAWSLDRPAHAQGWRQSSDSRGLPWPGNRLMAHVLWEWVKEIRVTSSTGEGHTVEIKMDASKVGYESASLLLTFTRPADTAEQRARVFADNVNSWLTSHGSVTSRKDGKNYIMSRHTPVGRVTWWSQ